MASRLFLVYLVFQVVSCQARTERKLDNEECGDRYWNARCSRLKNNGGCDNPKTFVEMKINCAWTCGYCSDVNTNNYKIIEKTKEKENEGEEENNKGYTTGRSQTNLPTCGRSIVTSSRVIAGTDATLGEWPWQAWLHIKKTGYTCGGSLISPQWVLTAAHCILETEPEMYHVVLGDVNRNETESSEQVYGVDKIIVHAHYDKPVPINNDLALLRLSRPARINSFVNTVCLPRAYEKVPIKTKCYVTGWGMTRHPGKPSTLLQQAPMAVASSVLCQASIEEENFIITPGMVCAGDKGHTRISACFGDSGGPFVCRNAVGRWVLQGVVSWGEPTCNSAKHFSVFARVSLYRDWIEKTIQGNQG